METETYHLVTVTVTYKIDGAGSCDEALDIAGRVILPAPHLDGVILDDYRDVFCSAINETEQGIECTEIVERD